MGVTVSSVKKLVDGSRRVAQATLAFTTSATNGDSLLPTQVGMHVIEGVKPINGAQQASTGHISVSWDASSNKIQLYTGTTANTAAATATVVCEFVGW